MGHLIAYILMLLVLVLTSCAKSVTLRHAETGEVRKCEVSTGKAFMVGAIAKNYIINSCIEENEARGFKRVDK